MNKTPEYLLYLLEKELKAQGSQRKLAKHMKCSVAYINDVLRERRQIGDLIANALGYEKITYTEVRYKKK